MKKLVFVFAVAFSASLFSCNNSNATAEATDTVVADSSVVADSVVADSVDSTATVVEEVVEAVVAE